MKTLLLLGLLLLSVGGSTDLQAARSLAPAASYKANPNRLQRTMRRLHRQAQTRARKNRYRP